MAVEWMDNFSNYGTDTTNMLDGLYSTSSGTLVVDPDGVSSGYVYDMSGDGSEQLRRVFSSSTTTIGVMFRVWFDALPLSDREPIIAKFGDVSDNAQVTVVVQTTGGIAVYRDGDYTNTTRTLLAQTAGPVITAAAWSHLEIKVVIDDAVGAVEIRVNGLPVIEGTDLDTKNTTNTEVSQVSFSNYAGFYFGASRTSWKMKDLLAWNTVGSSNNDFMGDIQVVTLAPNGDSSFNWNASTGTTGFDLIDETSPNDADFISAADPPPAASVFNLADLDPDIVTVKALQPMARMWKTDGGTANVQMTLTTNAANDAGADRPITVAATYWFDISELSPDTGVSWTPTEVNNALFSINRTL